MTGLTHENANCRGRAAYWAGFSNVDREWVAVVGGEALAAGPTKRCLIGTAAVTVPGADSSWVEPDYLGIPSDADRPADEAELRLIWPGPAMLMPAGLLPDGRPQSSNEADNAERVTGVRPRNAAEADAYVLAYLRQQSALRAAAGLAPAQRDGTDRWAEEPYAMAAIRELHRQERARRRLVETPPVIAEFLDRLAPTLVDASEEMLRVHGLCPPPAVHMICADMDPPYVGMLTSRPYYRGPDATEAVAAMGALPSALWATHLVVVWEHADLCTALELPGKSFATGVVVLDATISEHTVRWHPFEMKVGPLSEAGVPTVLPEWQPSARYPGGWLPDPVRRLLASWRAWSEADEPQERAVELERAGYRMRWTARA